MAEIIEFLPSEIRTEIFSRLSVDSIIQCKLVCKTWRKIIDELLINNPSFADMHTQCQFLSSSSSPSPANAAAAPSYCSFLVRKKSFSNDNDWSIVGSCNGLVCLVRNRDGCPSLDVYICNPVTREYTNLPPVTDEYVTLPVPQIETGVSPAPWKKYNAIIATGLGYHDSTKEYKFVRIAYDQEKLYVSMYKLGSGTWSIKEFNATYDHPARTTGAVTKQEVAAGLVFNGALYWSIKEFNTTYPQPAQPAVTKREVAAGLLLNGVLYWYICPNTIGTIVSFDLEKDEYKFTRVLSPPRSSLYVEKTIWVCRERFYMIRTLRKDTDGDSTEIWEMNMEQEEDYTWIMIDESKPELEITTFALEEKIVLSYDYMKIGPYDPRIRSHEHDLEMIPYTRNLVSLRALGESVNVVRRRVLVLMSSLKKRK